MHLFKVKCIFVASLFSITVEASLLFSWEFKIKLLYLAEEKTIKQNLHWCVCFWTLLLNVMYYHSTATASSEAHFRWKLPCQASENKSLHILLDMNMLVKLHVIAYSPTLIERVVSYNTHLRRQWVGPFSDMVLLYSLS